MKHKMKRKACLALVAAGLLTLSSVLSGCLTMTAGGYLLGKWMKDHMDVDMDATFSIYDGYEEDGETEKEETDAPEETEEADPSDTETEDAEAEQGDTLVHYETPETYNEKFVDFTNQVFAELLDGNTINIHFTVRDPEAWGLDPTLASWGDFDLSDEAVKEYEDTLNGYLETLESFDYESLNWDEQICYDSLKWYVETELSSAGLELYYEPLGPNNGQQSYLPVYLGVYAFDSEQDVKNYLELVKQYPDYFEQVMAFEHLKKEAGLFMEDELLEETIEQCETFLEGQEDSFLYVTFDEKIDALGLDNETAEAYKKTNREYVDQYLYPTYTWLIEELEGYYGSCQYGGGICNKPEGKKYYEYLVKSSTGSEMTPEEMIALLEEKMTQYMGQIRRQYMENALIYDLYDNIEYPTTDPNLLMRMLQELSKEDYPDLSDVDYNIQYIDESLRDYMSPACYFLPQVDAPNTNNIFINCDRGEEDENLFVTIAHEGYPGHLLQSNYALENSELPLRFLLATNGYAEGWAQYVESHSYSYLEGVSESVADFAFANDALILCIYARVDLGVNYEGWGLDEVNDLVEEYFGRDPEAAEWMYYYVMEDVGGYLDYCIGLLEIETLYERASSGGDITRLEFNTTLLDLSGAPYGIVRKFMFE